MHFKRSGLEIPAQNFLKLEWQQLLIVQSTSSYNIVINNFPSIKNYLNLHKVHLNASKCIKKILHFAYFSILCDTLSNLCSAFPSVDYLDKNAAVIDYITLCNIKQGFKKLEWGPWV